MHFQEAIGFIGWYYGGLYRRATADIHSQPHNLNLPSLLLLEHLDSRCGRTLCALRIHAGHNPTVDNVVVIPNTFGSNICTKRVSAALCKDVGNVIAYTQRRATLHARRSMAPSTTEDRP
jgi:hypothetical protein